MKIPNYDTNTNPTAKRRLNNFGLDEDFRMLIAGQSGCGKTNTLMYRLRTPLVFYDKIYIFSPNLHQNKLTELQKLMNEISEKVGYPVLEMGSETSIPNTNEYPLNNRKVVVFDDLVNADAKIQNKIANHFTDLFNAILLRCSAKTEAKLFSHDSLSTINKESLEYYCQRKSFPHISSPNLALMDFCFRQRKEENNEKF